MSIIQGTAHPAEGYNISRSLRFNSADSAYLNRTPSSAGNRKTWTLNFWYKESALTNLVFFQQYTDSNNQSQVGWASTSKLRFYDLVGGSFTSDITWTRVFRDPSAWYMFTIVVDTTQATNTNRIKFYVNGVQETAVDSATWPAQNTDLRFNNNIAHFIGQNGAGGQYSNYYLTEVNFIDGQALTPSSFGETDPITGVWKPKKYTGTYGTNGFYLNFSDNSGTTSTTLGKDYSGNGNNWTPNNFSITAGPNNDSLVDVPTLWGSDSGLGGECRGNYATLNPLLASGYASMANGNLESTISTSGKWAGGTISVSSGKYYFEAVISGSTPVEVAVGIAPNGASAAASNAVHYYSADGKVYSSNVAISSTGATWTNADVIGVAFEPGAEAKFYKNGVLQSTVTMPAGSDWCPEVYQAGNRSNTATLNFGQRAFAYAAPSGYKALCTTNLPEPTIKQGDDYFNVVTWTGDGSSSRSITGVGFQPDLVWVKARDMAYSHRLTDAVRGANKQLYSDLTNAETSDLNAVTAFNADGFQIGNQNQVNENTKTFVAWNWKANGAGVTNTAGTITSTVSANTTSGFSIVTYTGTGANATVGHGLGVAPRLVIVKNRTGAANDWSVWHTGLTGGTYWIALNSTGAQLNDSTVFTSAPTSTVFNIGTGKPNQNTLTYVAYCFAPVAGFSAFGSYTGNGSADGPFVYTGFRPRYILVKASGLDESWYVYDSVRNTYNALDLELNPNNSGAEATFTGFDFVSNGFKVRSTNSAFNTSTATYIYAAFAEVPFRYSLGR